MSGSQPEGASTDFAPAEKDIEYCLNLAQAHFRRYPGQEPQRILREAEYTRLRVELRILKRGISIAREQPPQARRRVLWSFRTKPDQSVPTIAEQAAALKEYALSNAEKMLRKQRVDPRTVILEAPNPMISLESIRSDLISGYAPERLPPLPDRQDDQWANEFYYDPSLTAGPSTSAPSIISSRRSLAGSFDSTDAPTVTDLTSNNDEDFSIQLPKYDLSEYNLFNKTRLDEWLTLIRNEETRASIRILKTEDDAEQKVYVNDAEPVGSGGFGDVFKGGWIFEGDSLTYGGDVVAKKNRFVRVMASSNERQSFERRLKTEADITRSLQHPNIAQYIGLFTHTQINRRDLYLVSSYCVGGVAREYLKRYTKPKFAEKLFNDLVNGLAYMHSENQASRKVKICHGDLKGNNFLVDWVPRQELGTVYLMGKIADFGLSSILTKQFKYNNSKVSEASRWLAPELAHIEDDDFRKREPLLELADVWSFALTAIEIVLDEDPFEKQIPKLKGDHAFMTCWMEDPRRLTKHLPTTNPTSGRLSDVAFDILKYCWKLEPQDRPTMAEVREDYQLRLHLANTGLN